MFPYTAISPPATPKIPPLPPQISAELPAGFPVVTMMALISRRSRSREPVDNTRVLCPHEVNPSRPRILFLATELPDPLRVYYRVKDSLSLGPAAPTLRTHDKRSGDSSELLTDNPNQGQRGSSFRREAHRCGEPHVAAVLSESVQRAWLAAKQQASNSALNPVRDP